MSLKLKNMIKNKILITGASGLLGIALINKLSKDFTVIPVSFKNNEFKSYLGIKFFKLDIRSKDDVFSFFKKTNPDIVIHAASIGSVDFCEYNRKEAYAVNVIGTRNILEACKKHGSRLIFTSSNAVFDGLNAPYSEESETCPVNYYGETKVMAERLISGSKVDYAIVRLILMYGWNHPSERSNPVTWLIDKLKSNEKIKMVNDTYTNPLFSAQASDCIYNLIKLDKRGLFHLAGKDRLNRYELALKVADLFDLDKKLIEPVTSDYFKGIAKRMPDTTFDISKMEQELLVKPVSVVKGLNRMKKNKMFLK